MNIGWITKQKLTALIIFGRQTRLDETRSGFHVTDCFSFQAILLQQLTLYFTLEIFIEFVSLFLVPPLRNPIVPGHDGRGMGYKGIAPDA